MLLSQNHVLFSFKDIGIKVTDVWSVVILWDLVNPKWYSIGWTGLEPVPPPYTMW